MIDRLYASLIFVITLIEVESRVCYHSYADTTKYFYCTPHEYCCGDSCCQSYIRLSFYRLWYFWLTVIMILIFCSGSGYWFRRRYYRPDLFMGTTPTNSSAHPMSPPSYSVHGAPVQAPAYYAYQMYGPPPSYETVYAAQPAAATGPPAYTTAASQPTPSTNTTNNK